MKEKQDIRIVKTKTALKEGLMALLKEETFDKITISRICDYALVNRVTFYTHYEDKYELFNDCLNDVKDKLVEKAWRNVPILKSTGKKIEAFILSLTDSFIDLCVSNRDLLKVFTLQENSILTFMVQDLATKELYKLYDEIKKEQDIPYEKNYLVPFLVGGTSRLIYEWITHGAVLSESENYKKECIKYVKIFMR